MLSSLISLAVVATFVGLVVRASREAPPNLATSRAAVDGGPGTAVPIVSGRGEPYSGTPLWRRAWALVWLVFTSVVLGLLVTGLVAGILAGAALLLQAVIG